MDLLETALIVDAIDSNNQEHEDRETLEPLGYDFDYRPRTGSRPTPVPLNLPKPKRTPWAMSTQSAIIIGVAYATIIWLAVEVVTFIAGVFSGN